ncbi:MAG: basic secretory family protein [Bacteroides sp.]|nr:basic secretory family protein [Bacteroides sp.]MCM1445911.1 basic secretory family protein [Prevotella sp.]
MVPHPERYIADNAAQVLNTLYFSPNDSIAPTTRIFYTLEDIPGVSAKDGEGDSVRIFFSSRHVENFFEDGDTARVLRENRGVLLHELTHAYQLEPQGIGTYSTDKTFRSLIEGIADAVRILNGGFEGRTLQTDGHYTDGYQPAACFFVWIVKNKDRDFIRKLNRSTLDIIPWSYDAAFRSILNRSVDDVWQEYQRCQ